MAGSLVRFGRWGNGDEAIMPHINAVAAKGPLKHRRVSRRLKHSGSAGR
jgi:hypothetical protein